MRPVMRQLPFAFDFALIAGVEPTVLRGLWLFPLGAASIREKYSGHAPGFRRCPRRFISTPGIAGPTKPGSTWPGSSIGADGGGFRESVDLQDRNAQHHEEKLRFDRQRSRATNQGLQIGADDFANCREHQRIAEREPEKITKFRLFLVAADKSLLRARENCFSQAAALVYGRLDSGAHAFQQRGYIQEIFGRGEFQFVGELGEVGGEREGAMARKSGEQKDPGRREAKWSVLENCAPAPCARPSVYRAGNSLRLRCGLRFRR